MPVYDVECVKCGHRREVMEAVGQHSSCVKCGGATEHVWTKASNIQRDEIPGGFIAEHGFHTPTRFDSWKEYYRAIDAKGLRCCAEDKMGRGEMDPQTLENARILVSRARDIQATEPSVTCNVTFTVRDAGSFTVKADPR